MRKRVGERETDGWSEGWKFQRRHWFYVIPAIRRLPFPAWATRARNSNTTQERTPSSSSSSSTSSPTFSSPLARNSRRLAPSLASGLPTDLFPQLLPRPPTRSHSKPINSIFVSTYAAFRRTSRSPPLLPPPLYVSRRPASRCSVSVFP